jgi:hypothetical protein
MGWTQFVVDTDTNTAAFSYGNTGPGAGSFYTNATLTDGQTMLSWNGSSGETAGGTAIGIGTWYYAAIVVSGTGAGQFKNYLIDPSSGTVYTITQDGNSGISGQQMIIGDDNYGAEGLNGRLANVLVYADALSLDAIKSQMWQMLPISTTNLNGWYPLLDNSKDYSGNGNDWTENGSITWEAGPGVSWGGDDSFLFIPAAAGGGPTGSPWYYYAQQ